MNEVYFMKKKISKIAGLVLAATLILAGCSTGNNDSDSGKKSSTETFQTTTVYNPNTTKVKLIAVSSSRAAEGEEVCEVEPKTKQEVELGSEHDYYFTDKDGKKIADLAKADDGRFLPVYLELNEPKEGSKYLLLNQYKNAKVLEDFPRDDSNGQYNTYGLLLYEVINEGDPDAYHYKNNAKGIDTYIRMYPSANLWIDSEGYASNKIETEITYNEEFINNFTNLSDPWPAWGWSTKNDELNMYFCHRVVSYIYHAKDGDTYTPIEIGTKITISFYNPTSNAINICDKNKIVKGTVPANDSAQIQLIADYQYTIKIDNTTTLQLSFKENNNSNFYLKPEYPETGKNYMCLNQYKETALEKDGANYSLYLYEIVDNTAENSYEYSEDIYIRSYPSASLWIDNGSFVQSLLGKQIIYSDELLVQNDLTFNYDGFCWGWSTQINNTWYCRFIYTVGLHKN